MRDFDRTVVSQYANSPVLTELLDRLDDAIDPSADFEAFYQNIWNIVTAHGYGLGVWGRIVGVNQVLAAPVGKYLGFDEASNLSADPFGQSPFYAGEPLTENYALSDQAYLRLILAKAAANITDGSIAAINRILMALFPGRGNAYVTDGANVTGLTYFGFEEALDAEGFGQAPFGGIVPISPPGMTMVYTFRFPLEPFEVAIVTSSGVLPRSTGVKATASYLP
jgi:hypothetical protein